MKRILTALSMMLVGTSALAVTDLEARLNATAGGREILHGCPRISVVEQIDTNNLIKVTFTTEAYPDAFTNVTVTTNAFVVAKPSHGQIVKRERIGSLLVFTYADGFAKTNAPAANIPPRLAEIRAMRAAAGWTTNQVVVANLAIPTKPRIFSKLKCVAALTKLGCWPQVKAYIEAQGMTDLYLAATDFKEDNEYFAPALAAIKAQLGLTDEQAEEILKQCIAE